MKAAFALLFAVSAFGQVDWLQQVKNKPFIDARQYAMAPQTPGGALAVGQTLVKFSPVPLGVNGSDAHHYLYVSAGTGTAEACLITGGSGVSGMNGVIALTCANTHSGAWTVQSASGGIQEAVIANGTQGYAVKIPIGQTRIYAPIWLANPIELYGAGMAAASGAVSNNSVSQLLAETATGDIIHGISQFGFYLHDFQINSDLGQRTGGVAIYITGPTPNVNANTVIERISFNNQFADIHYALTTAMTIRNTYHQEWATAAIYAEGNASIESAVGEIYNNYFLDVDNVVSTKNAIEAHCGYGRVHDNLIVGGQGGVVLIADASAAGSFVVNNNTIENQSAWGVLIANGNGVQASQVQVFDNEFEVTTADTGALLNQFVDVASNSGGSGSWVTNVQIQRNTMRGQLTSTTPIYIQIGSGSGVLVADNIINHIGGDTGYTYAVGAEAGTVQIIAGPETGTSTHPKYTIQSTTQIFDQQGVSFSSLVGAGNGSQVFVTDANSGCTAGSSTGQICERINGAWTH